MIYDHDNFDARQNDVVSVPFIDQGPFLQFTAGVPLYGMPPGTDIVVCLITSFDNVTWWAWVFNVQRFAVVTVTIPPNYCPKELE